MSTEQDSVRRLAEIRAALEAGAVQFGPAPVTHLLSLIDSLTAERDRFKRDCEYADETIIKVGRRAEAAEAEVKRLREALMRIDDLDQKDVDLAPSMARAALATPPSEGGQSNG